MLVVYNVRKTQQVEHYQNSGHYLIIDRILGHYYDHRMTQKHLELLQKFTQKMKSTLHLTQLYLILQGEKKASSEPLIFFAV